MFAEQIFCNHAVVLSIHAALLPVADKEAHIFKKGSPLLKTRVVGTYPRTWGDPPSPLSADGHALRSLTIRA